MYREMYAPNKEDKRGELFIRHGTLKKTNHRKNLILKYFN